MNEAQSKAAWYCVNDPRLVTMMAIAAIDNGGLENVRSTVDEDGNGIFAPDELEYGAKMLVNAGLMSFNGTDNAVLSRFGGNVVVKAWHSWWQYTRDGRVHC